MNNIVQELQTLRITKSELIAAPADVVWEALLHQMGPDADFGSPQPMNFTLEPFPGGRWWRDLGDNNGHLWAHVQVIKTNKVLELCGPMFMSYAANSHMQYKLVPDGEKTRLDFTHTAFGLIPADVAAGMSDGSGRQIKVIRERAEASAR